MWTYPELNSDTLIGKKKLCTQFKLKSLTPILSLLQSSKLLPDNAFLWQKWAHCLTEQLRKLFKKLFLLMSSNPSPSATQIHTRWYGVNNSTPLKEKGSRISGVSRCQDAQRQKYQQWKPALQTEKSKHLNNGNLLTEFEIFHTLQYFKRYLYISTHTFYVVLINPNQRALGSSLLVWLQFCKYMWDIFNLLVIIL